MDREQRYEFALRDDRWIGQGPFEPQSQEGIKNAWLDYLGFFTRLHGPPRGNDIVILANNFRCQRGLDISHVLRQNEVYKEMCQKASFNLGDPIPKEFKEWLSQWFNEAIPCGSGRLVFF